MPVDAGMVFVDAWGGDRQQWQPSTRGGGGRQREGVDAEWWSLTRGGGR